MEELPIGKGNFPLPLIAALGIIKKCAAKVNIDFGLNKTKAEGIMEAANEVIKGRWKQHFPVSLYQSGTGIQGDMNVNEVVAKRAEEILHLKESICSKEDVNKNQSSITSFTIAMHISAVLEIDEKLVPALTLLYEALKEKANSFQSIVKVGRMSLQDSFCITLGQEFAGYASQIEDGIIRLRSIVPMLLVLPQTQLNSPIDFLQKLVAELSKELNYSFRTKDSLTTIACHDPLVELSGVLNSIAVSLMKIGNDIRFLGSGPCCGLGELRLPENEPGSSIMPGKVNPTQCEALTMICAQVMGNHVTVTLGGSGGHFELNALKPLIIGNVLHSIRLLYDSVNSFTKNCIVDIQANQENIQEQLKEVSMAH